MTAPTPASRVRRHPERASYEREVAYAILDEAPICHLGFIADGRPFVIPTIHARVGDILYIHGSPASRMLKTLSSGVDFCVTATIVDGVVFARSAFGSSMNYRSAMVMGRGELVEDGAEKMTAFMAVVEHVAPGRSSDCRPPTRKESDATSIIRLPIAEFSAKLRSGGPKDPVEDVELPIWAGVVPLELAARGFEPEPDMPDGVAAPPYVRAYRRPRGAV